ncbi:MAG: Kelch repeat-containing protein, partial [Planctomycetota bacterium]
MKWLNGYKIRLVLIGFIVSGFLSTASVCSAVEYIWTRKADMPTARWVHASSAVEGKIYVIGGKTSEPGATLLSTVEAYDPVRDTWTRRADLPTPTAYFSTCSVNGKIYAIGGNWGIGIRTVQEYNPVTDRWTRKADMPTRRHSSSASILNGQIYVMGGSNERNDIYPIALTCVEAYDPQADIWTTKADMLEGLWGASSSVVNGRIYTIGGRTGATDVVLEYNLSTDIWGRKASIPTRRRNFVTCVLDGKIYAIGGWIHSNAYPNSSLEVYDPEMDIWTVETETPFLRACFSASVVNNRIYVIGGTDRPHPCRATSTVYEFGPLLDFNWDGIVDSIDMCILIDNWYTDNPRCDIAPLPFGDGIVDIQDLTELSEHLFEEISPLALIGHWKLDEDEGDIAYNSISDNHGILSGNPIWQPDGGIVAGALQFDGIDDYVSTDFVLNPTEGKFSVIAWIKGGVPGQVIIAQHPGVNWL